jgi:hypothetical protein
MISNDLRDELEITTRIKRPGHKSAPSELSSAAPTSN